MKYKAKYILALSSVFIGLNTVLMLFANHFLLERGRVLVEIKYQTFEKEDLSIYWNNGKGYTDQNHLTKQASADQLIYKFSIESLDSLCELRLDPDSKFRLALLEHVTISGLEKDIHLTKFDADLTNGLNIFQRGEKYVLARKIPNTDPFLRLRIPPEFNKVAPHFSAKDLLILFLCFIISLFASFQLRHKLFETLAGLSVQKSLLIFLFISVTSSYWTNDLLNYYPSPPNLENRALSAKPNFDSLYYYPKKYFSSYTNWFSDHLPFKQALVFTNSFLKLNLFHNSPKPESMYIGENFEFFSGNKLLTDDITGKRRLSQVEIEALLASCAQKQKLLADQKISYYLTIPPSKQNTYSELLPKYLLLQAHDKKMIEQFKGALTKQKSNYYIDIIDPLKLRHILHSGEHVFYQYDLHWSDWGAFLAYQKLINTLATKHSWIKPALTLDEVTIDTLYTEEADLAKLILMQKKFKKEIYNIRPKIKDTLIETIVNGIYQFPIDKFKNNSAKGRVLVFRDSYSEQWKHLIARHFNESIFIWDQNISQQIIDEYKPDIVIQENCEMFLFYLFNPMQINAK